MEDTTRLRRRREVETKILEKVGDAISSINEAKHVDEVICALHSLAVLLFPLDSSLLSGCIDVSYRDKILSVVVPCTSESDEWRSAFYQGSAFPTLAKFMLYDVASNWLACLPLSARMCVYDSFFVNAPSVEVVQAVIPGLLQSGGGTEDVDFNAVCSNTERILILCLLENKGVLQMAREFGDSAKSEELSGGKVMPDKMNFISRVAQLLASIPDKARRNAPATLSSHLFFKQIAVQLLAGIEGTTIETYETDKLDISVKDGTFIFIGETFARICRRGSADILVLEMISRILDLVRSCSSSNGGSIDLNIIESNTTATFWTKMMDAIKDPYAMEKMSEQLLRQLDAENASDVEAYWTLWILFHKTLKQQASIRSMFAEKFLLWKVFPICCLRWILQFAVLGCPPSASGLTKGQNTHGLVDRVQCLGREWCKREFVQRNSMEQQAYVTAALGLLLEKMSKDELETTKDVMHMILQGVSCRLESPIYLVRRMASCVALAFSKVVDPKNPLFLDDDSCNQETIDWEFGNTHKYGRSQAVSNSKIKAKDEVKAFSVQEEQVGSAANGSDTYSRKKNLLEFKLVDPDEIIDPATLNNEYISDEDEDDASENSETMSDSSLQPYDLSDDDTDLKRKFSQLIDIVGALRKPDDPDGVERALDVAEDLVRASPDELRHVSGELVRAFVQLRCSDLTVEGEEESAEIKRQRTLTALLVMCPFESLDTFNSLLYSPNLDTSQRILILDTMTDAAQELADAKSTRLKHQQRGLISTISESQPWFLPSSRGPTGASPWKEVSETGTPLNWSYRYERELPLKPSQIKTGKSRRWSLHSSKPQDKHVEWSKNKFPIYAAAFMLPAMQSFDKKRHGVDLLGGDFIVLGKLIYMLGTCMRCTAMHPEASALAPSLLDMLSSRDVSDHAEAYVRRSVAFAASCVLTALHPSFVASALVEGNSEISSGLEWIRTWSLRVAESDTDTECSTMAMTCLRLHAEMALQASRALESTDLTFKTKGVSLTKGVGLPSNSNALKGEIKIPHSHAEYQI